MRYNDRAGARRPAGIMKAENRAILTELWWEGLVGHPTSLVVRDEEVAHFLCRMAEYMHRAPCFYGRDCDACNIDRDLWWDWCNNLAGPVRIRLQRVMRECDIPLPP